jgi:hypothetical protein
MEQGRYLENVMVTYNFSSANPLGHTIFLHGPLLAAGMAAQQLFEKKSVLKESQVAYVLSLT